MTKNSSKLFKSFSSPIIGAWKKEGAGDNATYSPVSISSIHEGLVRDITLLQDLAQFHYDNDKHLLEDISKYSENTRNNTIGGNIGIQLPSWVNADRISGCSRLEYIYQDMIVRHAKSEQERIDAFLEKSHKYVSTGCRRTASPHKSTIGAKISLSAVNKQYCEIINMPDNDGYIDVKIVIEGQWYLLRFNFDNERFTDYTKICLPDIHISDKGIPVFSFAVEYPYIYKEISSEYIVGVDVGISNYATVVVTDSDGNIVHASTLSENVHSLTNSIQATQRQIAYLHTKRNAYLIYSNEYHDITQEIALHRKANINKKQELAIKTAQEIAYISYVFDNAVVVFEELSWVRNTMCNGRWNRGELFKKTKEYVELNGGRIIKVSAYNTSQECCSCHKKVMFHDYHTAICKDCDVVIDRDVNAAANIANRARKTVEKCTKTRKKAKKFNKDKKRKDLRTPIPTSMKKKRGSSTTRKKGKKTGKCYNKKQAKQFYLGKQKYKEVMTANKNHGTDAHNDDVKVSSDEQNTEAILIQDSQKATRKYATLNSNATIA